MELKSIKTNKKNIVYTAVYNVGSDNVEATEERKVICHELPKDSLGEALQNLNSTVIEVMGFVKDYREGMVVDGFSLSHTKNGTRSMEISFTKQLDNIGGKPHKLKTPFFRIDDPADGENGSVNIEAANVKACKHAIHEAKSYAKGDRSQMTFKQYMQENGALSSADSEGCLIEV